MKTVLTLIGAIGLFYMQPCAASAGTGADILAGKISYNAPIDFSEYQMPAGAAAPAAQQAGTLRITTVTSDGFDAITDPYGASKNLLLDVRGLPDFAFDFVIDQTAMIPVVRGAVANAHHQWEWLVEPGRVWQSDNSMIRYSIPFALMERAANCVHNGVLMGNLDATGTPQNAILQIASETCLYFKFNKWSVLKTEWQVKNVATEQAVIDGYRAETAIRLPMQPVSALKLKHAALSEGVLAQNTLIDPNDMTLFGAVVDGVHFVSGCETRSGTYPYCDVLPLPSYSLAKSMVAGLALMRLEKLYPGAMQQKVSDFVPLCKDARWQDVTLENLLDMASGNYISPVAHTDENEHILPFFNTNDTREKLDFSCSKFARKDKPGVRWVYRTTDTYILSAAIDAFWKQKNGENADYYDDILVPVWRLLGLSPLLDDTRRSEGAVRLPYAGYGLIFHRDDIARLSAELASPSPEFLALFDETELSAALQQRADNWGLEAQTKRLRYNNGYWAWNMKDFAGCETDSWVPFMSGFGGISVVMMPGGTVYYYFSDSGKYPISGPIAAFAKVKPVCKETS